jgi:hypothetical protein
MGWLALSVAASGFRADLAASARASDAVPSAVVLDTLKPRAAGVACQTLEDRLGWQRVPQGKIDYRFQGDAVAANGHVAVVLRNGASGAEVYSRSAAGWHRRAVVVPFAAEKTGTLASVTIVANDSEEAALEAAFQPVDGKTAGLVCRITPEGSFVTTQPQSQTARLALQSAGRFGVIPDFYADDITLDAVRIGPTKVRIPSDNMFAQLLDDNRTLAVMLWDGPPQDVEITLAGSGAQRAITGTQIACARPGKIHLAFLDFPGACYVGMLDQLPERSEPISCYKLKTPVRRLDWRMPFPAQWRVDFLTEILDSKLVRSREMLAPYPYPPKDHNLGSGDFRFIKPAFVWDWGGGKNTERGGGPDTYPSWVDADGRGFVQPIAKSYAIIAYPFDRGRGTPPEGLTLTDLVRQTLGVGPCQYILDADRRMAQTPGIFTCGGTSMLKKLEGHVAQHRAEAEKHLDDMLVFVTAYHRRVEQYQTFKRETMAFLDSQLQRHPGQKAFVDKLKSLLDGIPAGLPDYPNVIAQLNVEYRATLDSDDEAARKKRELLRPRYTAAGGAQDNILAKCHQTAKLLRCEAGMTLTDDPVMTEIAREVRKRASAVLQNPMYHETKDRHRV